MVNVDFSKGLVPAVVRDAASGDVLMLAYLNEEALQKTIETGETWFWSRSRGSLWNKGATSGNRQRVVHISTDCDRDAVVVTVEPAGPACHSGARSCFADVPASEQRFDRLIKVLQQRRDTRPAGSYSTYLFNEGRDKILKKVGEEATEVVIAAKGDSRERLISEVADLTYHLSVLLVDAGLTWADVEQELSSRA